MQVQKCTILQDQHHLLKINPETQKPRNLATQTQSSFPCFPFIPSILPQLPDLHPRPCGWSMTHVLSLLSTVITGALSLEMVLGKKEG